MDGYLYVASRYERYLTSAEYSAASLKDHHPDANITLFTEERFYHDGLLDTFDIVVTEGVPNDSRAKLWALSKTPYDRTLYIDADSVIQHADIANVFDELGDHDIMLTKIRPYRGAFVNFPGGSLDDHCGVFLYNNEEHTINFMRQWWELWKVQKSGKWQWDTTLYPDAELRPWDQWSYWWLQNKTNHAIDREYFPFPDARWNFVHGYKPEECAKEDIVIYHHTLDVN
jgi:hypothetical protein